MRTTRIRATVATAAIAATVLTPTIANANQADTLRNGSCSIAADWKLKLSPENGRIEVEYQVDANDRGQRWRVSVFHDGRRVLRGVRTTRGLSGSFTIRDREPNRRGSDHFRARAVRLGDGQTCVGRAAF
jgi:hypothetical protein